MCLYLIFNLNFSICACALSLALPLSHKFNNKRLILFFLSIAHATKSDNLLPNKSTKEWKEEHSLSQEIKQSTTLPVWKLHRSDYGKSRRLWCEHEYSARNTKRTSAKGQERIFRPAGPPSFVASAVAE